jgi:hypothetical protein
LRLVDVALTDVGEGQIPEDDRLGLVTTLEAAGGALQDRPGLRAVPEGEIAGALNPSEPVGGEKTAGGIGSSHCLEMRFGGAKGGLTVPAHAKHGVALAGMQEGETLKGMAPRRDGRWVAVLDLGWRDGKRARKYFYARTREQVARKLARALAQHQQGYEFANERLTVEQFLGRWLEAKRGTVGSGTWTRYEELVRLHVNPRIGRHRLAMLKPDQLQHFYSELQASRSPATVLKVPPDAAQRVQAGCPLECHAPERHRAGAGPTGQTAP